MAATQYQVFCRYLNETVNRTLTNKTTVDWISAEKLNELTEYYDDNRIEYEKIVKMLTEKNYAYTLDPIVYALAANTILRESQLSVQQLNIYTRCKEYDSIQDKISKEKIAIEYCIVEPADSLYTNIPQSLPALVQKKSARDMALNEIIIAESTALNPKYDMVFMYDGIAYAESRTGKADYNPPDNDDKQIPYVYYERMKRVKLDPWFLFSTHASLASAMTKAKELVNILGKDAVKIGKVVPLDQYLEIV